MLAATLSLVGALLLAPAVGPGPDAGGADAAASAAEPVDASVDAAPASIVKMADLSQFQAGNIISDARFFDRGTMSAAQIQQFLEAKVPACQAGYTCLRDWYDTSRTTGADAMCGAYAGGVRERASTIIYKVAQACGINPQVLLVILQKEQGLVTHVWPSDWRYTIAMGQGCPDTAACDTRYYGFFNQVYGAAWQLKRYANPPGTSQYFTWYAPGKTWNVRWHPNAACGSSPVYIQNQATADLYYYTPYQPNAAAIRAGYGEGDGCSSYGNRNFFNYFMDWFGSAGGNPFGNIELVQAQPGQFRVSGWAADPDTTSPIAVHVYVGAVGSAFQADRQRADVGAAYPTVGSAHGFDVTVPAGGAGSTSVCVYAINTGGGANVLLGCTTLTAMSGSPTGKLDTVTVSPGAIDVAGWAVDPDSTGPTSVHVYVGATGTALPADKARNDIPNAATYGANHGFAARLSAPAGPQNVCAYAINIGPGGTTDLGCRTVTVPGADLGRAPIGALDDVAVSGTSAVVKGWAIDPDTASPIKVHLYVGAAGTEYTADKARPDIGTAYPAAGPNHGFVETVTLPVGTSQVCAYGINTGPGGHTFFGCKTVTVAPTIVDKGRPPVGSYESLTVSGSTAVVKGWALDPDVATSIKVHIYVGAAGTEYTADASRSDVAAAYPGYGDRHGVAQSVALPVGTTNVCLYAINNGAGGHTLLGCKTATVAATSADLGRAPIGNFEAVTPGAGGATVSGWALDPDTTQSVSVHIYVDSVGVAYTADKARSDVGAAYRLGDAHGFAEFIAMSPGAHTVCVYPINTGPGGNAFLGCRTVTVP